MTWYYDIADDRQSMDVYEDDSEFTGLIQTVQNDGSGFTIPNDVTDVMRSTWEAEVNTGQSPVMTVRAGKIQMDMIQENIEPGKP